MPFLYDEVPYSGFPQPQTHPDRLATIATLLGMAPAPIERCRVLELGCGDGANLIPMALALPESEFVGIDLAEHAIALGREKVRALGLERIDLQQLDLMNTGPELGEFDYIISHGLYSWTPPAVRDQILNVCRRHLAPRGVAYVSYNAYPGFHRREMFREMMLYYVRNMEDPGARVREGVRLIRTLADLPPESKRARALFQEELQHIAESAAWYLYHDDLAETNAAVYFHEFVEHARRHRLQFLAEADFYEMQDHIYPQPVTEALKRFAAGDIVRKEQYLDFMKGQRFRQTLLCHEEVTLHRQVRPEEITGLYLAADVRHAPDAPLDEFRGARGAALRTDYEPAKAALRHLAGIWPRWVPFPELSEQIELADDDAADLAVILFQAYEAGLLELHIAPPGFVQPAGERPVAGALARLEARSGALVTSLRHTTVDLEDAIDRHLLLLLDGTRDRAALLGELREFQKSRKSDEGAAVTAESLATRLDRLARQALLSA